MESFVTALLGYACFVLSIFVLGKLAYWVIVDVLKGHESTASTIIMIYVFTAFFVLVFINHKEGRSISSEDTYEYIRK